MLRELRVRNYAIIDDLDLGFSTGLNVLTGETGAGKSIIVGALGIALGQRAYAEMVRTGAKEAVVEAFFEVPEHPLLAESGIASAEGIVIRRHVSAAGKSRAYVNDVLVNVQTLSALGDTLVDMHGQHQHQSLLNKDLQMDIVDHFGHLENERSRVGDLFREAVDLRRRIDAIRTGERERAQKLDLLRFQVEEIEQADPKPGEDRTLEEERLILANLARLNELIEHAHALLYRDDGAAVERLGEASRTLSEMADIDPGVAGIRESLEQALPLVEDAALSLRNLRESYDTEPGRLERIEDRLELLGSLKRKYGDTIEAVREHLEKARREASDLEHSDKTTASLAEALTTTEKELAKAAAVLSEKRRAMARRVEESVSGMFEALALEKASFSIALKEAPLGPTGGDDLEFLFSANPGEQMKPLGKVASGGELSRVMLALKTVMRKADDIPVLVFDEVDAGIGGATARNVARALKQASAGRQVLCITHLPQIASVADSHYLIEKETRKSRTYVRVGELTGSARDEEVARMLSGSVTETSLEHAREMIADQA